MTWNVLRIGGEQERLQDLFSRRGVHLASLEREVPLVDPVLLARTCETCGQKVLCCGQSYKQFEIVIYDFRVVPDLKISRITNLDS